MYLSNPALNRETVKRTTCRLTKQARKKERLIALFSCLFCAPVFKKFILIIVKPPDLFTYTEKTYAVKNGKTKIMQVSSPFNVRIEETCFLFLKTEQYFTPPLNATKWSCKIFMFTF